MGWILFLQLGASGVEVTGPSPFIFGDKGSCDWRGQQVVEAKRLEAAISRQQLFYHCRYGWLTEENGIYIAHLAEKQP